MTNASHQHGWRGMLWISGVCGRRAGGISVKGERLSGIAAMVNQYMPDVGCWQGWTASADCACQFGISQALVADLVVRRALVFLLRCALQVRDVRKRVHGRTLLAEAEQQGEDKGEKQAP